jgi:hypothetical protein
MRILILGGYGTFGGRLARLLAGEAGLNLLIAGRSAAKAEALRRQLQQVARSQALSFDRDGDVAAQLAAIRPDLLVDASGPFQAYGADPYRVAQACIAVGSHYMDLADSPDFVQGIADFDAAARAAGVYVLSGVSSFPVLTAAVVRRLSRDMVRIDHIRAGIAPSPYAGVGLNVIRAIAGYAGKPVSLRRNGKLSHGNALTETMRYTIMPPGHLPLNNIRFSLVDVPDLRLLPELWPELDSIWIGAGPVPEILHRMLNGLAWLVRLRLLPSLSPFARLFHFVIGKLSRGEHRGGMFVEVRGGGSDGQHIERSWHLLAEGDDGPFIPSMAVEAIVRRALVGVSPMPGARAALKELELEHYEALFRNRVIHTGVRETSRGNHRRPLYQTMLGSAWTLLPENLRAMHAGGDGLKVAGRADVERGGHWLARCVAMLFGFPKQGRDVPVEVQFTRAAEGETWRRTFAGKSFSSHQSEGRGRWQGLLCERFGPFAMALALIVRNEKLFLVVRRWSFFGLPLPAFCAPGGTTYESVENGRFHFHVEISHPWIGLLVRYRGWLVEEAGNV